MVNATAPFRHSVGARLGGGLLGGGGGRGRKGERGREPRFVSKRTSLNGHFVLNGDSPANCPLGDICVDYSQDVTLTSSTPGARIHYKFFPDYPRENTLAQIPVNGGTSNGWNVQCGGNPNYTPLEGATSMGECFKLCVKHSESGGAIVNDVTQGNPLGDRTRVWKGSIDATQKPAPTPRPGGACAALLRPRCHRTHHHHLRQCLPRTTRPLACWPHHSFVQRCVPCTPRASGAHYAPLLAVAVRTAPASGRSAMQAPRRPRAEQPGHIDLRSYENPTTSAAPRAPAGARACAIGAAPSRYVRARSLYTA
eukprot:COSAG02_NODE_2277_length_9240_cov_4.345914_6_plen_310_part_00